MDPRFLVASPSLVNDMFNGTVVLLIRQDEEGAHGLVINRPLELPVGEVCSNLGLSPHSWGELPVLWGGPVDSTTGFVVLENPWPDEDLVVLGEDLAVGVSKEILARAMERDKQRFLLCLGYSGWGPGQLESELDAGAWIDVDLNPELVFDAHYATRWADAIASLGISNPAFLSTIPIDE